MAFKDDIQALENILEKSDDSFVNSVKKLEVVILRAVVKLLKGFDSKAGRLIRSRITQRLLNRLNREVLEILQKSDYPDVVSRYLKKFDRVEDLTINTASFINNVKVSKTALNGEKLLAIDDISKRLTSVSSVTTNLVQPIRNVLLQAIRGGASIEDTEQALKGLIGTNKSGEGFIRKYARQVATDGINQYGGTLQQVIASEYELNAFRYVGSLIATSRDTCIHLINGTGEYADLAQGRGVYLIKDIPEIIRRSENNSGWIQGTTPENFFIRRGGYGCRHRVIGFRLNLEEKTDSQKKVESI